jgi:hypothetical protein
LFSFTFPCAPHNIDSLDEIENGHGRSLEFLIHAINNGTWQSKRSPTPSSTEERDGSNEHLGIFHGEVKPDTTGVVRRPS